MGIELDRSVAHAKRLLVVEDEYLVADDMKRALESLGACVVGPVPDVESAVAFLQDDAAPLDGAILDVNLCGERVYPVADLLERRRVPFVFWTGYGTDGMPARYRDRPRLEKLAPVGQVLTSLLGPVPRARRAAEPALLADVYVAPDGETLLRLRGDSPPVRDASLRWLGVGPVDLPTWRTRLRVPLRPGIFYRVPDRYVRGLRAELLIIG